jgi:ribose 5-phosphate isomerase B
MKILIASDHAGYNLKKYLMEHFYDLHFEDLGTYDTQSVDYPDFADKLSDLLPAESLEKDPQNFGILICGSGQGMAIKANKHSHIRAALCYDLVTTRLSREHNNANVLCLGERILPFTLAKDMVETFLKTKFSEGRHTNRVKKLC